MALFYKAVKSTMATKSGDKKWHLNLVKVGKVVSTQQLAEMIAEKSSLTPGDVHNVVRNLMTAMRVHCWTVRRYVWTDWVLLR